jgi:hypothetical protein
MLVVPGVLVRLQGVVRVVGREVRRVVVRVRWCWLVLR